MKMLYGCPFEKNEKEVFFRLTTFFSGTKKFCSRNNFCSVFYVLLCKKKFRSDPKKIFLKKKLEILEKNKISKIFGSLQNFFLHSNTKTELKLFPEKKIFVPEKKNLLV